MCWETKSNISSTFLYLSNYMLFARFYHISKHYFQAGREIKLEIIYITEHIIYNPIYIPYQLHMTISLWMDQFSFLMNISSGLDRQKFEWIINTLKCHTTRNNNEKLLILYSVMKNYVILASMANLIGIILSLDLNKIVFPPKY